MITLNNIMLMEKLIRFKYSSVCDKKCCRVNLVWRQIESEIPEPYRSTISNKLKSIDDRCEYRKNKSELENVIQECIRYLGENKID